MFERNRLLRRLRGRWRSGGEPGGSGQAARLRMRATSRRGRGWPAPSALRGLPPGVGRPLGQHQGLAGNQPGNECLTNARGK